MSANMSNPPTAHSNSAEARAAPECSLLVCGLSGAVSAASSGSSSRWELGPVPDPRVNQAILNLDHLESSITLFRYIPPNFSPPGVTPPSHLHTALNLPRSKSGFLFVNRASTHYEVEESIRCLHSYISLMRQYGSRGFWVVIDTPGKPDVSDGLAARFKLELGNWPELKRHVNEPGPHVLQMSTERAYGVVAEAMLTTPQLIPSKQNSENPDGTPGELSDTDFLDRFLHGQITPWRHKDYLRAIYLTLLAPENRDLGLLDIATKFAADLNTFKQRNSQIQLLPASRTLTVFWLYHVKLAAVVMGELQAQTCLRAHFHRLFHYLPELQDHKLPTTYYSSHILRSECAEIFWMLPDLRALVEPPKVQTTNFREQFIQKRQEDPDRLLRFVFSVVQRYLRPGEIRRRSWFIDLAFASLQQETMRLRSAYPWISAYSETQSYFYLQLVHAALAQFMATSKVEFVQKMSYPLFKETFRIMPTAWSAYYSPQLWDSLKARATFVPPDLKPLPDTIHPLNFSLEPKDPPGDPNAAFQKGGLIPELPSLETLHFHQAVLIEDAKPIPADLTPAQVSTHAHLLKYIHTNLILPALTAPSPSHTSLFHHHLTLLTTSSPLTPTHIRTTLLLAHFYLHPPHSLNPDYTPPVPPHPLQSFPSRADPTTGAWLRYHNCPCHAGLPLPYTIGPDAVCYPEQYPYEHPPQVRHGCKCHAEEEVDQDAFAALCAAGHGRMERGEKERAGVVVRERAKGEGWEGWVRGEGGLVLCWEGVVGAGVVEGREGEFGVGWLDGVEAPEEQEEGIEHGEVLAGERDESEVGDGETLGGGEDEEEWEVVSQDTLC